MSETGTRGAVKPSLPIFIFNDFAERMHGVANFQKELFETVQETNRKWFERAQSEADFASVFASKLAGSRSLPDAVSCCQDWASRRFEMMAEDGQQFFADATKFVVSGLSFLANGAKANGGSGAART